jgi:hypothetical protein
MNGKRFHEMNITKEFKEDEFAVKQMDKPMGTALKKVQ